VCFTHPSTRYVFLFENMYLLTISSLPTGYWGDTCSPPPILSTTRRAPPCHINTTTSSLENERMLVFEGHSLLPPPFSLLPRKRAYMLVFEAGSFLPPPPFYLDQNHPPSTYARFRDRLLFATTPSKMSTYTHFRECLM
jgi:hypothetical protein